MTDVRDSVIPAPWALFLFVLVGFALAVALANSPRSCLGQADRIQVSWFCRGSYFAAEAILPRSQCGNSGVRELTGQAVPTLATQRLGRQVGRSLLNSLGRIGSEPWGLHR